MSPCARLFALPALILAAITVLSTRAESTEQTCDRRVLPRADTLSVEATARKLTGDKPQDVHVSEACIVGTTTAVTLITPRGEMLCERLQSTWYKRGGWKCGTPTHRSQ